MKVTHYLQGLQVEWSLSSTITQTDKFKLKTVTSDEIQKITVNMFKLINKQKCSTCKHLLSAEIIDADNIYTCPSC